MTLEIAEIEFTEIKGNIKRYLSSKSEFTDYNFEGSGLSYILDLLAYITHYNGFYLNTSVNEMFLGTAQLRKNVNSIARMLNYVPRRMTGAESVISISLKEESKPADPSTTITLSKYTDFVASNVHFYCKNEYQFTDANSYSLSSVVLRQGTYQELIEESTGQANQLYVIESDSIDNDTLEVYVNGDLWTLENNLLLIDEDSTSYSIELTDDNYVNVIFGDGIVGKIPEIGLEIKFIYTNTVGEEGNNYVDFDLNEVLLDNFSNAYDNSDFDITTVEIAAGGSNYETTNAIKINAPKFYETQGRLVTRSDYIAYLLRNQLVEDVNVWGGEDSVPEPIYGTIFICIKPVGSTKLTSYQEQVITEYIDKKNVLSIKLEYIDPIYFYINVSGTVYFYQQYEAQLSDIRNEVEEEITNHFNDLETFESLFKMAKFITELNELEKIANTNIEVSPFFYFSLSPTDAYYFVVNNILVEESIDCSIVSGDLDEGFYDDGNGNILTKKSGNAIIGEVNYVEGLIEIYSGYEITTPEPTNGFQCFFKTEYDDVFYKRNRTILLGSILLTYIREE